VKTAELLKFGFASWSAGPPNELQVLGQDLDPLNYAIALPFDSPLRRKLNIALVETTRSSWWREVVGRYFGTE
jgi:hypothetical protein